MKNIVCCCDGTWDKPGDVDENGKSLNSNVCLLYNALTKTALNGDSQIKMYETGVGTGFTLKDKLKGGVMGKGIDQKIKDIYTFLVTSYTKGDHIFLFGFSRGAYTARSLAGLIRNCGILKPEYINLVDKAYELYRDRNDYTKPDSDLMICFRERYCCEDITRIHFIGVWDTVGALGLPLRAWRYYNLQRYKFHDVTLSSTIDYAYQALAVDEHRAPFVPALWEASGDHKHSGNKHMEQRWFAGVHCDVGGGYTENGLSHQTLKYLIEKAQNVGLNFDAIELAKIHPNPLAKKHNSFTFWYWFTGMVWRKAKVKIKGKVYPNQVIDDSVYERMKAFDNYRPKNIKPEWYEEYLKRTT
jgi:uncharacterized protein (DUF2235 family)